VKVVISGIGWVNTSGYSQGRQAIFSRGCEEKLPKLLPKSLFLKPFHRFGRLDEYSKLGLAAIALALKDARLEAWSRVRNIAIISSTVFSCLNTDEQYYETVLPEEGRLASPSLFAYTLPNAFLGEAAIHFGLSGATYVINEPTLSGLFGMFLALNSIKRGEHETVIVGVCDYGPPPILSTVSNSIPEALFFVLQNVELNKKLLSYGELTEGKEMQLFFNSEEITNLNNLAHKCTYTHEMKKRDNAS
jgi:3-oxoacyl-[acyl-carrier-protein] synthase II